MSLIVGYNKLILAHEVKNIRLRIERLDTLKVLEQVGNEEYTKTLMDIEKQITKIENKVFKKRKWWQLWKKQ